MGSSIQEIFQGRGDKKGQGIRIAWVKRSIPLLFIILTWLGLLINLPVKNPAIWFSISSFAIILYGILHIARKDREFSVEFLFSAVLIYAGVIQFLNLEWLKFAYFPFIISLTALYSPGTVISLSLLIPLLELRAFISMEGLPEKTGFYVSLILTAAISSYIFDRLRTEKEKAESSLKTIKDNALSISHDTKMESLDSDKTITHYFASILKTDEEIKELLNAIKQALFADSVNLFIPDSLGLTLRSTTEGEGKIRIRDRGKGIISDCLKGKRPVYSGDLKNKGLEPGYMRDGDISTLFAVPVMEGSSLLGVLAADSVRYQAFTEPEKNTVFLLISPLVRILERERIYPKIKRDYNGSRILQEESSKLVSSLKINVIVEKLCEGAEKIASSHVFFFLAEGKKFELLYPSGSAPENRKLFDLKGTFINMAAANKNPLYMSNLADYKDPLMPFKTIGVRSAFVMPLIYENNLVGLLAMLSNQKDFLEAFQSKLLTIMCNQASTSIANAQLHAEIERMATTDGLTSLYNHRMFQEKFSEELKRLQRTAEPLSLLLTDIDYFKKINDTYGHPVGDLVLKGVAKIIRDTIRDIDIPARYGGEEFAVILPNTDSRGALNISERIRKSIMEASFSADGKVIKVTVSIGIATSPYDSKTKEGLIEQADQSLYHAKKNGRNQSVLWKEIR